MLNLEFDYNYKRQFLKAIALTIYLALFIYS